MARLISFTGIILLFLLVGCDRPAKEKVIVDNTWPVELCFEQEDHKVYRFSDGYNWRYYVVMKNGAHAEMINQIPKGKHSELENLPTAGSEYER